MTDAVLFEVDVDNKTAIITLNRPDRKNAINQALLIGLCNSIDRVKDDDGITSAIITGAGNSFCSGIDLECLATDNLFDPREDGSDLVDVFAGCHKPIIGAVNGYAITGGFEIALNCDFLIASEKATFADTHAKVGIHPGWGMTQLLQQAVGQKMAKQFSLTCEFIPAEKALSCGLVNEVVAPEKLLDRAKEIAGMIAEVNPAIMQTMKTLIECRNTMSVEAAFTEERKGFKAFVDKVFSK